MEVAAINQSLVRISLLGWDSTCLGLSLLIGKEGPFWRGGNR